MLSIGVIKEGALGESRVSLSPECVQKLTQKGFKVIVEKGAGEKAGYSDAAYSAISHCKVLNSAEVLSHADIITSVQGLEKGQYSTLKENAVLLGILNGDDNCLANAIEKRNIRAFALQKLPRTTRAQSMDINSSQSNLSGYRAVIEATHLLGRAFPLMMTAAGTIRPAKVLVLGAGVAGLQAIATAKRLGAVVSVFDVRQAAKEQVESLGATFVSVPVQEDGAANTGYAKEMSQNYQEEQNRLLAQTIAAQDVVITTALIPGKKAPILVTKAMVDNMKPGAVIVDLAAISGGNCALSQFGKTIVHNAVTIHAPTNILSHIAQDASFTFSKNVTTFITTLLSLDGKDLTINQADDIVQATLITVTPSTNETKKVDETSSETKPQTSKTTKKAAKGK